MDAYQKLAGIYKDKGDLVEALKIYKRQVRMVKRDTNGLINLDILYSMMGNFHQAKKSLLKALDIDEHSPEANYNLAVVYFQKGELKKALLYLTEAEKLSPDQPKIKQLHDKIYSFGANSQKLIFY